MGVQMTTKKPSKETPVKNIEILRLKDFELTNPESKEVKEDGD